MPTQSRSEPVSRFRREVYRPTLYLSAPPWHLSVERYDRKDIGLQRYYRARCGYTYDAFLGDVRVSNARKPPAGRQCQDCLRAALKQGKLS